MRNSQLLVGLVFAASLGFGIGSCGSSSSNSDGSTSSGAGLTCFTGSAGSCTQAELDTYDNCVISQCGSVIATCFGSGYKTGSFSGPCASYGSCVSKCNCTDSACKTACGQPASACQTCQSNIGSCALTSTCSIPACLLSGGGTGGNSGGTGGHVGGLGGFSGGLGGSSGGLGGFSGGLGGFTGGSGTCADLLACCNATSAALKSACMSGYNQVVGSGDAACGIVLSGIKSSYCP